jgi:MoaA/NifB/PqqE/SkfB family radical SAM enzyme
MLWGSLYDAISLCTKKNILTDLTTNATLLNSESIKRLGKSGLDYLNISIDGVNISDISSKNFVFRNNLIEYLKFAKSKYRMHFRFNSVIFKNNFEDLKTLLELSNTNNVQISLGFVVPPIDDRQLKNDSIYFKKGDHKLLQEIVEYIIKKKKSGYPIIDPYSYYENIFRFLDREVFWDCNYPTRYGWINVTPNGKIRSCTKKMDELDIKFQDLNTEKLKMLRETLREKVERCNIDCYSNCAYDSYYYTHNKLQMLKKIMSRLKH